MSDKRPNIFEGRTKEWDTDRGKYRQYRSNQGRTPSQMQNSYKVMSVAIAGFLIFITIYAICGVFGLEL